MSSRPGHIAESSDICFDRRELALDARRALSMVIPAQQGVAVHFDDYQALFAAAADGDAAGLRTLLRLGTHAGALLQAHDRYLGDGLDHAASKTLIAREIGELLAGVAELATEHGLALDEVARGNVAKIRQRAISRKLPSLPEVPDGPVDAEQYQRLAALTDEGARDGVDPLALSVPLLGVAGEVGTLLDAQKKGFRDQAPQAADPLFMSVELGDILWYTATAATHSQLNLASILNAAVARAEDRNQERTALRDVPNNLPVLDARFGPEERFPRRMVVRFQQRQERGRAFVSVTLVAAEPNAFRDGPIDSLVADKKQGFVVPQSLGDSLSDNSRRVDHYRFHDAIHLGFLAVMGWSPLMRSLLQIKRRSDADVDEAEDGARAIFVEEGMAAVLAKRSIRFQGFLTEQAVDDESVEMLTTVVEDLEVAQMPPWLWKRAVAQGFAGMRGLARGPGGFLIVDLDTRTVTYSKTPPR